MDGDLHWRARADVIWPPTLNFAISNMKTIVNDKGFSADDWANGFVQWGNVDMVSINSAIALDVPNTIDPTELVAHFESISLIRIPFPSHTDGRGFTLARRLRLCGYTGRLRACGHILADQYEMARHCGFDEVEVDDDLTRRQPEDQWQLSADWKSRNYQNRLRCPK